MSDEQQESENYLLCGMVGCVLMGLGDWLMLYGDSTTARVSIFMTYLKGCSLVIANNSTMIFRSLVTYEVISTQQTEIYRFMAEKSLASLIQHSNSLSISSIDETKT